MKSDLLEKTLKVYSTKHLIVGYRPKTNEFRVYSEFNFLGYIGETESGNWWWRRKFKDKRTVVVFCFEAIDCLLQHE